MTQTLALRAAPFVPTTSVTGNEPATIYRGANCIVKGLGTSPRIEAYPGSNDLGENYDISTETITGTIDWTAGSTLVAGTATVFLTELRPGQMILAGTEIFVINRVVDDTNFIAERAPETTAAMPTTAYYMPILFELDKQRGVLRRGNAILLDRKDILLVGQGKLYLNGTDTGFTASRIPKRLQRKSDATYIEYPFGFPEPPPLPTAEVVTTGVKGMLAGKYSFLFSWYNEQTNGFSNPSTALKQTTAPADITLLAGGGIKFDFTDPIAAKPANADGLLIWGTLSGGGVADVNASNFTNGAWYETVRIPFAGKAFSDANVNTTLDTVTIPNHRFRTADRVYVTNSGGALPVTNPVSGFAAEVFIIRVDSSTIKFAADATDAREGTAIDITTAAGGGIHTVSYLDSTNKIIVEYLDAETGVVASGDNNNPPECEWVTEFANTIFYISCLGNRVEANENGTSPGKYVVPSKASNIEAAPLTWRVTVGDDITGFALGVGRLFTLTANGVPFVTPTGRTELASLLPLLLDLPFSSRPFWTKGGISPYNITVVQGEVYAWTGGQPLRSPSNADEKSVPFELGKDVADIISNWKDGHVFVVHDPLNQHICFISSATRKNDAGYWVSEILPLDLSVSPAVFQPLIVLSSDTRDMAVCGAAIINNRLEFLAGGRGPASTRTVGTFRYAEPAGAPVPYYFAFQPTDLGEEEKAKFIRSFRVTGRVTAPVVQVHGAGWGGSVNIADIENGTNSISGNISLGTTTQITRAFKKKQLVKNLQMYVLRVSGTWDGTGEPDRLDEVAVEIGIHGGGQ